MIKINLLKTRVTTVRDGFDESTIAASTFAAPIPGSDRSALVKLVLMALFVLPLIIYEYYNTGELKARMAAVRNRANTLQAELQKRKAEASDVSKSQAEIKELEAKIDIMKRLTKVRVRELKALDYLQTVIPDRVWLRTIDYRDDKVRFEGYAISDEDLSDFLNRLEGRNYFSDVILLQATEAKTEEGTVKAFEVSCNLETN